jgi:DNA polymerase elongation subunit (family B)
MRIAPEEILLTVGDVTVKSFPPAADVPAMTALDIETETRFGGGLDPLASSVVAVALAFDDGTAMVFDDADEVTLLTRVDEVLRSRNGLLLTWNGAGFDLPFIAARARVLGIDDRLGLVTVSDAKLPVKYAPPAGLGGPVRARWHATAHVDVAHLYREFAESEGLQWSLKPIARRHGLEPVEVDRTAIHELTPAELEAYVVSDAVVTLDLARRQPTTALLRAVLPL